MTQAYTEDPLLALVRATAEEQFAALRGREVLVAVSGGADSLALLDVLLALRSELRIELAVAHFDHRLRPESGEQARVLADYVGTLHLPYELGGGDVRALAREHGLSVEAAARRARYSILGEAATRRGSPVVVGHNRDDQAETVLLNLVRGAGLTGLAGMRPVSPLAGAPGVVLVRPLLGIAAAELRAYSARRSAPVQEDPTNQSRVYARNRVRLDVLPLLAELNAGAAANIAAAASLLRHDVDLLEECAAEELARNAELVEGAIVISRTALSDRPRAVQLWTLRAAVRTVAGGLEGIGRERLDALLTLLHDDGSGKLVELPQGVRAITAGDSLVLWRGELPDRAVYGGPLLAADSASAPSLAEGWRLEIAEDRCLGASESPPGWHEHVRRPAVGGFSLRTGVPEERFVPLGMGRSRRVRDILADRKTPHVVRSRIPMLTAEGEPVWLVGVRISDDWKVGAPTDPFVCLRVRRDEGVRPP